MELPWTIIVVLWVNRCKNKSFWQIFTCTYIDFIFFFQPYISDDELRDSQDQGCVEGCEAYYTRNFFVTQCVLASTENVGGDVLFVGHASTLDACAQQLIGN